MSVKEKKEMGGEERRQKLLEYLNGESQPLSGTELAKRLKVSRQVIVQDIALLRAVDKNILSTNKGYVLYRQMVKPLKYNRSFRVSHEDSDILEELYTIVDLGGKVLDVVVEHEIYGQITVDLIIISHSDADDFYKRLKDCNTKPLKELTDGIHYHTVEADSLEILDEIEKKLKEKGFLL